MSFSLADLNWPEEQSTFITYLWAKTLNFQFACLFPLQASQVKVFRPANENSTNNNNNNNKEEKIDKEEKTDREEKTNKESKDDEETDTNGKTNNEVLNEESEKEKEFDKLMEVYENRKKSGLSESLTTELKNRKRKQQQRQHRNKSSKGSLINDFIQSGT